MKKKYNITGMTCASCQAHVTKAVNSVNGTKNINVNLLKNTLEVEIEDSKVEDDIIKAVKNAGYGIDAEKKNEVPGMKDNSLGKLIFAIIDLLLIMYLSMGHMIWDWPIFKVFNMHHNPMGFSLIQFILVLPIIFIYRKYFINGFKMLKNKAPNMDTLIAIGAMLAIIYGVYSLFMISLGHTEYHMYLYFEAAGMILTLVSLGKYLEGISKRKTTAALEKLMDMAPKEALVLRDEKEALINADEVVVSDVVIVKAGMQVPVDGIVIAGKGSVDESNITGESMPAYKDEGKKVYSSTLLTSGYLQIKATQVGENTSIANIIKLVDEASNSKAPISKLADRISGVFVPIILIIGLITFIVNMIVSKNFELALNFGITVIVIACPCALGLATPVAIMVGTGKGAVNGLLIKNAEILENAHNIKTVVFDKTGTITYGNPSVVLFEKYEDEDILSIVYSLEKMSEHPLAKAIIDYGNSNGAMQFEVLGYEATIGMGIEGTISNDKYYIGNLKMLEYLNIHDNNVQNKMDELALKGQTPLVIVKNNNIAGIISLKDEIKPTSKEAIKELNRHHIRTIMLTGDNKKTANAIAAELGGIEAISEVLPTEKQDVIKSFKSDNKHLVAMVGDGVNDALALTSADIGIAIGAGSDVAIDSADIVLIRNDLLDVLNVIDLSKRVLTTIKLGLFWAFFYNIICVVLATGFLYYLTDNTFKITPMIGSVAMSLSSVCVVLNALTINFFKPHKNSLAQKNKENTKEKTIMNQKIFNVEGMMCNHCKAHVEEACMKLEGVSNAEASLENKCVKITCDDRVTDESVVNAITAAGYKVK